MSETIKQGTLEGEDEQYPPEELEAARREQEVYDQTHDQAEPAVSITVKIPPTLYTWLQEQADMTATIVASLELTMYEQRKELPPDSR